MPLPFRFGCGESVFLKARSAISVVPKPVVQAWYEGPLCWKLVVLEWYEGSLCGAAVMGSRVLCWAWFQIEARCASRDSRCAWFQIKARYAGVVLCACGRRMRVASGTRAAS